MSSVPTFGIELLVQSLKVNEKEYGHPLFGVMKKTEGWVVVIR